MMNMRKIKWHFILIGLVAVLLIILSIRHTSLQWLPFFDIDEYAFHRSLLDMIRLIRQGDILTGLFAYGFYTYGTSFWWSALLLGAPGILFGNRALAVILPRYISIFSAIIFLFLTRKHLKKNSSVSWFPFIIIAYLSMPSFIDISYWFHPDMLMVLMLAFGIYYAFKANLNMDHNYWISLCFFSVAVAVKTQAIVFAPFWVFIFISSYMENAKSYKYKVLDLFLFLLKSMAIFCFIYVILNPYLIHPRGLGKFHSRLLINMKSNATGHNTYNVLSFTQRLRGLTGSYINLIALLIASVLVFLKRFIMKIRNPAKAAVPRVKIQFILMLTILINILYLGFFVNKDWAHYYLSIAVFLPWLLLSDLNFTRKNIYIVSSVLLINLVNWPLYTRNMIISQSSRAEIREIHEESTQIIYDTLEGKGQDYLVLLSPYAAFPFNKLDADYRQVVIRWGEYTKESIDDFLRRKEYPGERFLILSHPYNKFNMEKARRKPNFEAIRADWVKLHNGEYNFSIIHQDEYITIFKYNR